MFEAEHPNGAAFPSMPYELKIGRSAYWRSPSHVGLAGWRMWNRGTWPTSRSARGRAAHIVNGDAGHIAFTEGRVGIALQRCDVRAASRFVGSSLGGRRSVAGFICSERAGCQHLPQGRDDRDVLYRLQIRKHVNDAFHRGGGHGPLPAPAGGLLGSGFCDRHIERCAPQLRRRQARIPPALRNSSPVGDGTDRSICAYWSMWGRI